MTRSNRSASQDSISCILPISIAPPPFAAARPEFREVPEIAPQHRPLQRAESQKVGTLNEEKFLKERAELNADKEEEKEIEKRAEPNSGGIVEDYYLDEAMAITADYLNIPNLVKAR